MTFGAETLAVLGGTDGPNFGIVKNSLIFEDGDSPHLDWTGGTQDDDQVHTMSFWVRRGNLGGNQSLCSSVFGTYELTWFASNGTLEIYYSASLRKQTTRKFRDPSAWYHIVIATDLSQVAAGDQIKVYVNGVQETDFVSETALGAGAATLGYGAASQQTTIGEFVFAGHSYFDGYMAQCANVDGQALGPGSFGEFDSNGVWIPKDISGLTFGTTGWFLDFAVPPGTGNGAGTDVSGNGNHFTDNNLAAGDQSTDTPVRTHCTFNPICHQGVSASVLLEGNRKADFGGSNRTMTGTFGMPEGSGLWYLEFVVGSGGTPYVGLQRADGKIDSFNGDIGFGVSVGGDIYDSNTNSGNNSIALDDTSRHSLIVDMDNFLCWWGEDGTWYSGDDASADAVSSADIIAGLSGYDFSGDANGAPWLVSGGNSTAGGDVTLYVEEVDWTYTPPEGCKALHTANLPRATIPKGAAHFDTLLYTGDGVAIGSGGQAVTGLEFQPDLVWIKNRDAADDNQMCDVVRGVTKTIEPNQTAAEATVAEGLASFDAEGFTVGDNAEHNTNSEDYVARCWKANGAGVANAVGSISSVVSVNAASGLSVVTYTGDGNASATIGHGLGAVPGFITIKNLGALDDWYTYHEALASDAETDYLKFNTNAGVADSAGAWNDTAPTDTVFTIGTDDNVNASGENYIAYCFAPVAGFSRFGMYTGNGNADGPVVHTGFTPAFLIVKEFGAADDWVVYDTSRSPINPMELALRIDSSASEISSARTIDRLSNGFKLRTSSATINANSGSYVFIAFAEHPFGGSNVFPARAV